MNNLPTITKNLLIINVLMFLGTLVAERYGLRLQDLLALHYVRSDLFNPAQLITYMFMHGGFTHLFFNMFAVWMFGRILEQVWGAKRFLTYYLVCGIGAGLIQELVTTIHFISSIQGMPEGAVEAVLNEGSKALSQGMNYVDSSMAMLNVVVNGSVVGASGAVYAILLAFGMLFPNEQMYVFPLPFPIKAKFFVIGYAVIELMSGLANNPADNVAHFAHLGGMLFGWLLIIYWRKKNRRHGFYYR